MWLALLGLALGACTGGTARCQVADAGTDAWVCPGRLVIGPVNAPSIHGGLPGGGEFCSSLTAPMAFHARVFEVGGGLFPSPHGLVQERAASCGAGSDYLDLGTLPPGEYDVAIENEVANADGAHVIVGADAIREGPCLEGGVRPYHCAPLRLTVSPCGVTVVPAAMLCEDEAAPCYAP